MRWGPGGLGGDLQGTPCSSGSLQLSKRNRSLVLLAQWHCLLFLLELHNFTQPKNCWLDLLWIWWVKIMNVREITLQQCSIWMLSDCYWENNTGTLDIFCFKDEQILIWKLTSCTGKNAFLKRPTKVNEAMLKKQVQWASAPRGGERCREMCAMLLKGRERS